MNPLITETDIRTSIVEKMDATKGQETSKATGISISTRIGIDSLLLNACRSFDGCRRKVPMMFTTFKNRHAGC